MKRDGKLSRILHILMHMAEHQEPSTSETLAKMLSINPVVVRQILAGLREKGYVRSEKGHGGGWKLVCDLSKLTLRDVYTAIGSPSFLAISNKMQSRGCLLEETVNSALEQILQDTDAFLLSRLGDVTLANLNAGLRKRIGTHGGCNKHKEKPHA